MTASRHILFDLRLNRMFVVLVLALSLMLVVPAAASESGAAVDWQESWFTEQNVDLPPVAETVTPVDLYEAWFHDVNAFLPASFQIFFNSQ